ncbi:MAG: molybdopterin-binding protein [Chloroflexi bacterium]|nr:molybdopterin-binding protein [Chloroflexota bacterium]
MRFGPVQLDRAEGKILGHNIAGPDGRRLLRKGKPLTPDDLDALRAIGRASVYVAELEPGDISENDAARRIANAIAGRGLTLSGPASGRANLLANALGVARIDAGRLARINEAEGITLATIPGHSAARARQIVATVKIIPYAVPERDVARAEAIAAGKPVVQIDPLPPKTVGLILSGSQSIRERIQSDFTPPLRDRVAALGSEITAIDFISLEDESGEMTLAERLADHARAGAGLIILAGETAIMDRHDIAPRAIERAGGEVTCFGAPVDPGNLLMVGYLGDVPIMGAPGCARSRKTNVVDWIIPRLLAGDRLTRADIVALGHGGLLEEIPERPMPRGDSGGESRLTIK